MGAWVCAPRQQCDSLTSESYAALITCRAPEAHPTHGHIGSAGHGAFDESPREADISTSLVGVSARVISRTSLRATRR